MREQIVKLAKARNYQIEIQRISILEKVSVEADWESEGMLVVSESGDTIGALTENNWVTQALLEGEVIHAATVNSISPPSAKSDLFSVNVRFVVGRSDEHYEAPPRLIKYYKVKLSGSSHHQEAIRKCKIGDTIALMSEINNPFDDEAIGAFRTDGSRIGYVPKGSWLYEALNNEMKPCSAKVLDLTFEQSGIVSVVVNVALGDGKPISEIEFQP